jgi:hypothetical protein
MRSMFKVSLSRSQLISPTDPVIHLEPAIDCDGSECGIAIYDEGSETLIGLPPHFHLVESQQGAWTRRYAVGGDLPEFSFESSH